MLLATVTFFSFDSEYSLLIVMYVHDFKFHILNRTEGRSAKIGKGTEFTCLSLQMFRMSSRNFRDLDSA